MEQNEEKDAKAAGSMVEVASGGIGTQCLPGGSLINAVESTDDMADPALETEPDSSPLDTAKEGGTAGAGTSPEIASGGAVEDVQRQVRRKITPPRGTVRAEQDSIPAFTEIEDGTDHGEQIGNGSRAKYLGGRTRQRQPDAATTPLPIVTKHDTGLNENGNGNGNGENGNGSPKEKKDPFEISREIEPSADLLKFVEDFQTVGWPLETPKMPSLEEAQREFLHMFLTDTTEQRISDAIKLIESDPVLNELSELIGMLLEDDTEESRTAVLLKIGESKYLDEDSVEGLTAALDALKQDNIKSAIDKLIKIQGQLYYERLAALIAYFSGRITPFYEAALHGYSHISELLNKKEGTPKKIVEIGCGDADILRGLDKIRKRLERLRPLKTHVVTPGALTKTGVGEKINEVDNQPDRIRDPNLIGMDYTRNFPLRLEREKNINAVQGDISDPELLNSGLPYLEKNSVDVLILHMVADRVTDIAAALDNAREMAREGARFHIGVAFPLSNIGDSMTEGVPPITFWNKSGDMRQQWMAQDLNIARKKLLFDLRADGFAAKSVAEHKHAVISPHSYLSVKEFRAKYAANKDVIDMALYDDDHRQAIANALGMDFPEYGITHGAEMDESERILIPQHYIVFDVAGRVVKKV